MKKAERTKAHILESVAPVFNTKGFAGTSLADLTEASGLTKGGLYGNFATKQDIAIQAFRYATRTMYEHIASIALLPRYTPVEQLLGMLEYSEKYVLNPPVPGGCVLLNTAVEADDNQPALRGEVQKAIKKFVRRIAVLIQQSIDCGELEHAVDAEEIACNIFCSIEGAIMMSRVQGNKKPIRAVVSYWKRQIESWRTV